MLKHSWVGLNERCYWKKDFIGGLGRKLLKKKEKSNTEELKENLYYEKIIWWRIWNYQLFEEVERVWNATKCIT